MTDDFGTPITPLEPPKKKNTTLIIVIVILVVLLICCCLVAVLGKVLWDNGDEWFGSYLGYVIPLLF